MAKDMGHSKENIASEEFEHKNTCKECGKVYIAKKTTYKNGDVVISPERCDLCQTNHLVGVRMSKVVDGLKGLSNLKNRINTHFGSKGKDAIKDTIAMELKSMLDTLYSTQTKTAKTGFSLKSIIK